MKTSAVLFTNRTGAVETPLLLKVFDDPVYYENNVKFLGLILDCKLHFFAAHSIGLRQIIYSGGPRIGINITFILN